MTEQHTGVPKKLLRPTEGEAVHFDMFGAVLDGRVVEHEVGELQQPVQPGVQTRRSPGRNHRAGRDDSGLGEQPVGPDELVSDRARQPGG